MKNNVTSIKRTQNYIGYYIKKNSAVLKITPEIINGRPRLVYGSVGAGFW